MIARILATTAVAAFALPALAQTAPPTTGTMPAASGNQTGMTTSGAQPSSAASGAMPSSGSGVSQGATVYDPQGGMVGRIESVTGNMAVVATQTHKVQLPMSSFAKGPKGPVIAMTAAQLDQAAAQAAPAASATPNVTQGASVTDTQGGAVGTISEVDAQYATVTLTTGSKVRLPVTAFGAGTNGTLRVAMTAAQLSAAGAASGSSSTSTDTSGSSSGGGQ